MHTDPALPEVTIPSLPPLQAKFATVRAALQARNINRSTEVDVITLAIAIGAHVEMLGPPGTGKTRLIRQVYEYITNAKLFAILIGQQTDLAEVRGPMSITAFKNDELRYLSDDYLPGADMGVLDEGYKGNSGLLNHLLGELEGGHVSTAFLLSNEPGTKELAAFCDRFLFRLDIPELVEAGDIRRLLDLAAAERRLGRAAAPSPILDWAEVEQAKAEVAAMPVSDAALDAMVEIFRQLRHGPPPSPENPTPTAPMIVPSNRRMARCLNVAQGTAWMEGAAEVGVEHLEMLVHVLPECPEQRRDIERTVYSVCSPGRKDAIAASDRLAEMHDAVEAALAMPVHKDTQPNAERAAIVAELDAKLGALVGDIEELASTAVGRTAVVVAELEAKATALSDRLFEEGICGGRRDRRGRSFTRGQVA